METRRQEVANGVGKGKSLAELADKLKVHYRTVTRDFDLLRQKYASADMERYEAQVAEYLEKLDAIEAALLEGLPTKVAAQLVGIGQERAKVQGIYAPSKSLSVSVGAESSPLFLKMKKACAGLDEAQLDEVMRHAAALPRTRTAAPRDASWFPPAQLEAE
jgi:hypothetical protein